MYKVFRYQKVSETPKGPSRKFIGTETKWNRIFNNPFYGLLKFLCPTDGSADFELFSACLPFERLKMSVKALLL